ncbi:MAG: oligoribonuclease [Burkholderiales bacterium]|nr:MAG: oligoribonuclease [Burkholderiales bacterium]
MSQQTALPGSCPDVDPVSVARRRPDESLLVWVDMEMTGLNPIVDRIIEVAIVVTDVALETIAQSDAIAIRQPAAVLDAMDQWNRATHGRSGLIDRVLASSWTEATAEQAMLDFLAPLVPAGSSPMCGNSICQDRRFMARYMPRLEAHFHYRNIDVSTLKELCKRWRPEVAKAFVKRSAHTAMADIAESIDELRHYRDRFLSATPPG